MPRGRKPKVPPQEPTWIPESRDFSKFVVSDVLRSLHADKKTLSRTERKSLVRLESMWSRKLNAEESQPESNTRPLTPPPPRKPRKKASPKPNHVPLQESTWIPESRDFSKFVVSDILRSLHADKETLSRAERKSLVRLESMWSRKFNAEESQPESNTRPLTPPPPRKSRKKAPPKPSPGKPPKPRPEDGWHFVHSDSLPDNKMVWHRICIPRLRAHWKLTYFNVRMPAYAIKQNIMDKYVTWAMLDRLMAMDNESGTAFFQEFADNVVAENPLVIELDD